MKIDLKPGEVICDKCNGTGYYIEDMESFSHPWCPKCHGAKKVDWVSNAIWKKEHCHYIKPGVYTQEVDLSARIPSFDSFDDLPDEFKLFELGTNK